MEWTDAICEQVEKLKPIAINDGLKKRVMGLIDFTRLKEEDTESQMALWCQSAQNQFGHVAAVCVLPAYVRLMATNFAGSPIKIATVVNFPNGDAKLEEVLIEINRALSEGANEIDVVFPYHRYLASERQYTQTFVETCKTACGNQALLKVILEVGILADSAIIADATYDVIKAGADFVKTSTGRVLQGASFETAAAILLVLKHLRGQVDRPVGIKISGGVKDLSQALLYLELAENIMGRAWVDSQTFRIGSSQLVDEILKSS